MSIRSGQGYPIAKSAYLSGAQQTSDVPFAALHTARWAIETRGKKLANWIYGDATTIDAGATVFGTSYPIMLKSATWFQVNETQSLTGSRWTHAVARFLVIPVASDTGEAEISMRLEASSGATSTGTATVIPVSGGDFGRPIQISAEVSLSGVTLNASVSYRPEIATPNAELRLIRGRLWLERRP